MWRTASTLRRDKAHIHADRCVDFPASWHTSRIIDWITEAKQRGPLHGRASAPR